MSPAAVQRPTDKICNTFAVAHNRKKKTGLAHNIFGAEYCKTHTFEKAHFTPLQSRITFAVPSTVKYMVLRTPSSFAHNTYCISGVWQVGPWGHPEKLRCKLKAASATGPSRITFWAVAHKMNPRLALRVAPCILQLRKTSTSMLNICKKQYVMQVGCLPSGTIRDSSQPGQFGW